MIIGQRWQNLNAGTQTAVETSVKELTHEN
ncbi:hypothetical protein APED_10700 [Acanthopleuribacter pedis]